jgi:hypothetical protein
MFVLSGLTLAGIGVGVGLAAAAGVMRLMKSLLFGISPFDRLTYVAVPLILVANRCARQLPASPPCVGCGSCRGSEGRLTVSNLCGLAAAARG